MKKQNYGLKFQLNKDHLQENHILKLSLLYIFTTTLLINHKLSKYLKKKAKLLQAHRAPKINTE